MTSLDGASHWGPRPESPFAVVNRRPSQQRALQQREDRRRSAEEREAYAYSNQYSYEEDEDITPLRRRQDERASGTPSDGET